MKILCTNSEFKVAVNNTPVFEFKHRIREVNQIDRINILHDVSLTSVNVDTLPWDTSTQLLFLPYPKTLPVYNAQKLMLIPLSHNTVNQFMLQYKYFTIDTMQVFPP